MSRPRYGSLSRIFSFERPVSLSNRSKNILRTGNLSSLPQPPEVVVVKLPDVLYAQPQHEQALEATAPRDDGLLDPERPRHLWPEYPRAAHLQPLPDLVVV